MKNLRNNLIVCDLNKAQWIFKHWRNQYGNVKSILPTCDTVRGEELKSGELALYHPDYPVESMVQRGRRLGLLDVWTLEVWVKFNSTGYLVYTGDKGQRILDVWNAKIYGKQKRKIPHHK